MGGMPHRVAPRKEQPRMHRRPGTGQRQGARLHGTLDKFFTNLLLEDLVIDGGSCINENMRFIGKVKATKHTVNLKEVMAES